MLLNILPHTELGVPTTQQERTPEGSSAEVGNPTFSSLCPCSIHVDLSRFTDTDSRDSPRQAQGGETRS